MLLPLNDTVNWLIGLEISVGNGKLIVGCGLHRSGSMAHGGAIRQRFTWNEIGDKIELGGAVRVALGITFSDKSRDAGVGASLSSAACLPENVLARRCGLL